MGWGYYSVDDRKARSAKLGYSTKNINEIFSQESISNAMDPQKIQIRESRDSQDHPESISIILALDVTGSMGSIPHYLVKEGLPHIMGNIIERGLKDPQLLFLAIGDHECDRYPLQVGQFESNDELLDKWLTEVYLEGGGGGNGGESYLLAWYFGGFHTVIDCYEKRKEKGVLFTIGDEPNLNGITSTQLKEIMGKGQFKDYSSLELLSKAREIYNVYHLHIKETASGRTQTVMDGWKEVLRENLIIVENSKEISKIIPEIVSSVYSKKNQIEDKPGEKGTQIIL